ncbi:MAG TPA: hypothetical protein VGI87_03495 [Solirubrobacteraceae bacterium]|jgi:glutathione synthase/RimK-type ligase-like ATP-grasp enzyme
MTARLAIATCSAFPQLPEDEPLLLDELRTRGVPAEPVVWDSPGIHWGGYELVVIRSTWDYVAQRERFLAWAESLPRVLNAPEVLRWNTDKRYLADVPGAIPTQFVVDGEDWAPPAAEFVVKPSVSAGARDAARYSEADTARARAHVEQLVAGGRTAMVQPYLSSVDARGETALLYFGGRYSHAIRKGPLLVSGADPGEQLYANEHVTTRQPDPDELAAGDRVLDALPFPRSELLYARVDLIRGPEGEPRLIELELTEPSLFLSHGEGAAGRLAEEIVARL